MASGSKGIWRLMHQFACLGLVAGGGAMVLLRHELPARLGSIGGMMVVLVGLLLSAPFIVGALVSALQPLVRATCGVTPAWRICRTQSRVS